MWQLHNLYRLWKYLFPINGRWTPIIHANAMFMSMACCSVFFSYFWKLIRISCCSFVFMFVIIKLHTDYYYLSAPIVKSLDRYRLIPTKPLLYFTHCVHLYICTVYYMLCKYQMSIRNNLLCFMHCKSSLENNPINHSLGLVSVQNMNLITFVHIFTKVYITYAQQNIKKKQQQPSNIGCRFYNFPISFSKQLTRANVPVRLI